MKKIIMILLVVLTLLCQMCPIYAEKSSPVSYIDASDIHYTEAVEVLSGIGLINGRSDGGFAPQDAITRAEMAKIMAVLIQPEDEIDAIYAMTCPFKDAKYHWAAGYIAYCCEKGIIAGRNEETFDPNAVVTMAEASKMLLVVLGYDPLIEGYTGSQWEIEVAKDAKNNDFFRQISSVEMGMALDRETAVQMIFNALEAYVIEYRFDVSIDMEKVDVTSESAVLQYGQPLYRHLYGESLTRISIQSMQDYPRHHQWIYEGVSIGIYPDVGSGQLFGRQ